MSRVRPRAPIAPHAAARVGGSRGIHADSVRKQTDCRQRTRHSAVLRSVSIISISLAPYLSPWRSLWRHQRCVVCTALLQRTLTPTRARSHAHGISSIQVKACSGRAVVARAQKQSAAKQAGKAAGAAALAAALSFGAVDAAQADISGLTPCSESKGFAKARKAEIKKLEKRKKLVRIGAPSLATLSRVCLHTEHVLCCICDPTRQRVYRVWDRSASDCCSGTTARVYGVAKGLPASLARHFGG